MGTAQLILKFDSLFDSVNSSTVHSPKERKRAMNDKSGHVDFFKEAIAFIKNLKVYEGLKDVTGRIKCLKGWLVTLNAILLIWDDLKRNHKFNFLLTRRLNTDPLENFFGTIRQQGGNSDNPTPTQFTRAFRKLLFSSLLTSTNNNCAEDLDSILSQFSKSNTAALVKLPPQPQTLDIGETDYREKNVNSCIIQENAVAYVAGYVLKKCFSRHNCSTCKKTLKTGALDSSSTLFCFFKSYKGDSSEGGLNVSTQSFLDYILHLEDSFVKNFSVFTKTTKVGGQLLKTLECIPITFEHCPSFPLKYMLKLFLRMRIYYTIKFANRDFASSKKKSSKPKKSRKYIKVTHL